MPRWGLAQRSLLRHDELGSFLMLVETPVSRLRMLKIDLW
jgi:hypothetical protein